MRKKITGITFTALLMAAVCGCQKAPEGSEENGIFHAKGVVEDEVASIVAGEISAEGGTSNGMGSGGINCTIGTEGNCIKIEAAAPYVPKEVYDIVLSGNSLLDKEHLIAFLGSDSGNVRDITEEALKQEETRKAEAVEMGDNVLTSPYMGNGIFCKVTDGNKTASFSGGVSAFYDDESLKEKCRRLLSAVNKESITLSGNGIEEMGSPDFTLGEAKELLMEKLSALDIKEIYVEQAEMYQKGDSVVYDICFTPTYDGIGMVYEIASYNYQKEVFPMGMARVCKDGVVDIGLEACLGQTARKEKCGALLAWEQVEKILETYLNENTIKGSGEFALTHVEILYYPVILSDNELELIPVWQIFLSGAELLSDEELWEKVGQSSAVRNICINAVSGEIERVDY